LAKQRSVFLALALGVVAALALTSCGGGKKGSEAELPGGKPTIAAKAASAATAPRPTATLPPRTPTAGPPAPIPADWTRHTVGKFQIGVPADWVATPVSPELIDALIEKMGSTNPQFAPYLRALKQQKAVKFCALEPLSDPTFVPNVLVGQESQIMALDDYLEVVKKQLQPLGATVKVGEQFTLRGDQAVRLEVRVKASLPNGESILAEEQMIVVDHAGNRYAITMTYLPEDAQKYTELFDSVVQTFTFVE